MKNFKAVTSNRSDSRRSFMKRGIMDGLFFGQTKEFVQLLLNMAAGADEARREL